MVLDFVKFVRSRDPDIVIGYEVQMLSWGYMIERARELDINLCPLLSRIPSADKKSSINSNVEQEAFWYGHSLELKFVGRILLNVWRVMRSEVHEHVPCSISFLIFDTVLVLKSFHGPDAYSCLHM